MTKKEKDDLPKDLKQAADQFDQFDQSVKNLTMDRMNQAPKVEMEQQTKIAGRDIDKQPDVYLKPTKRIASKEPFNEKFRQKYEFDIEYVHFIAENKEIIGETIEMWTKPYPGMPAEFWNVPVNKPIWAPRHVAEQIKSRFYHRLKTENTGTGTDSAGQYYGTMVVDTTVPRLDAHPVSNQRSIFMGSLK